jgi:hypothetical protein
MRLLRRNWKAIIRNQLQHPRMRRLRRRLSIPLRWLSVPVLWLSLFSLVIGYGLGMLSAILAGEDWDDWAETSD